jgi:acyl-CoA synthetase (NDP forming)
MKPDSSQLNKIFQKAEADHRNFLLEPEVYSVLQALGIKTPRFFFIKKGEKVSAKKLSSLRSQEVVLKIVSPSIVHKSDVGGVAFVENKAVVVNQAVKRMLMDVPKRFAEWTKSLARPEESSLQKVEEDIRGILALEKVAYEKIGFGSELLVGIRHSREFGPVVTMGLGGLDVEYVNERIKEGKAVGIGSAHLLRKKEILPLLKPLAFYGKLVKAFRGREALLSEKTLVDTYDRFLQLAACFSPYSKSSPYVIEEAEVNPLVVRGGRLIPLDGLCRFSRNKEKARAGLFESIDFLLHPRSIGIIGVSERMNLGHIILKNILREGFPKERVYLVKPGLKEMEGCLCVPAVSDLPERVDLFVLTLSADQSVGVMEQLLETEKARSVILIAGGIGEKKGTKVLEENIRNLLARSRQEGRPAPVVNGGNCMGIYSGPGRYDTTFIPEYKLPPPAKRNPRLVYISQSGAFMASRMSKIPQAEPLYAISLGNQIDLAASDYLNYFKGREDISLYALYIEGFKPGDGLSLAKAAKEIVGQGKMVVVYKSGRTAEGRQATSSHTASVAGDYAVCRSILESVGVFLAETLSEFENALKNLPALAAKTSAGKRVGLISNAGFECVILADNLKNGSDLNSAALSETTKSRLAALLQPLGIDRLQDIHNPLDVTPVADDAAFAGCVEAILADEAVDCAVVSPVPMTAALQTLAPGESHSEDIYSPQGIGRRLIEVFQKTSKPFVVNIDAGALYDPLANLLEEAGVPTFRHSDEALRFLGKFVQNSLKARDLRRENSLKFGDLNRIP